MIKIHHSPTRLGLALLLLPVAAFAAKSDGAKAKLVEKYDADHDGKLDESEIAALKKDFAANPEGELKRLDKNHDGKLSDEEITALTSASPKKPVKSEKKEKKEHKAKKDQAPEAQAEKTEAAK